MLADLVGKFSSKSTYSQLPSLSPELAAVITSLSGSAGNLGVAAVKYVGHARF